MRFTLLYDVGTGDAREATSSEIVLPHSIALAGVKLAGELLASLVVDVCEEMRISDREQYVTMSLSIQGAPGTSGEDEEE